MRPFVPPLPRARIVLNGAHHGATAALCWLATLSGLLLMLAMLP